MKHSRPLSPQNGRTGLLLMALLATTPALAHHGMDGALPGTLGQGLISGLAHPVIGLDHLAFLVVAALLSAMLSGAARGLAPAAFVLGTLGGATLHLQGLDLPPGELIVAASVLLGGAALLGRMAPGARLLSTLLALAGLFHGYAYAEAIFGAEATPLVGYLIGFSLVQYVVIAGLAAGASLLAARSRETAVRVARSAGLGAALFGGALLAGGLV
ncbi:MAG: HupE/UreJ family protein [Thiohalocapsa sp.]|nr:HupE/UreJ family protein [Thiohalocapsa sp.]MCF7992198.1 HupE/UreJ family protein [Thiohalocapsa sp.]